MGMEPILPQQTNCLLPTLAHKPCFRKRRLSISVAILFALLFGIQFNGNLEGHPRTVRPNHSGEVKKSLAALTDTRKETLRWQIALESWGFSPGVIDGRMGPKTRTAIAAAQASSGAKPTGIKEKQTAKSLGIDDRSPLLKLYKITQNDLRAVDENPPNSWNEKSTRHHLGYYSLVDALTEKFHTSSRLLSELNSEISLTDLTPGDTIVVPALRSFKNRRKAEVSFVEIDLERKLILLIYKSPQGQRYLRGVLHCSIAKDLSQAPVGTSTIQRIVPNPNYTFNPDKWPEVKDVFETLTIPPGPRNPVGLCWIALSRKGYGIHGTPKPTAIGKTGSHGCFRLTNWDVTWLKTILVTGTEVRVYRKTSETSWAWNESINS